MATVANLAVNFSTNVASLVTEFEKTGSAVRKTAGDISSTLDGLKMAFGAMIGAGVATEMKNLVMSGVNLADQIDLISMRTGVSVEALGRYKTAADMSGISLETLATGFKKLNTNIVSAQDGTGKAAVAFNSMGISVYDAAGNLKNADQVTGEIANKFASFPDGAIKSALAVALFGKAGDEMIPMLDRGAAGIAEFGLKIDQGFATSAHNFKDHLGVINGAMTQTGLDISKVMLPALDDAASAFQALFMEQDNGSKFGAVMSDVFRLVVSGAAIVVAGIKDSISTIELLGSTAVGDYEMLKGFFFGNKAEYQEGKALMVQSTADWTKEIQTRNDTLTALLKKNADNSYTFGTGTLTVPSLSPQIKPKASNTPNFDPTASAKSTAALDAATKAADKWLLKQQEEIKTLQQETQYIGKSTIEITKMKDARKFDTEETLKSVGLTGSVLATFQKQAAAIKEARQEALQAAYDQSRTFSAGASDFFAKYTEDAGNAAAHTKKVFGDATKGMEDALVTFVQTGKISFASMTQSIIADLVRIEAEQAIAAMMPSSNGGGGIGSAIMGGLGSIFSSVFGGGRAGGGAVASGTTYLVGENGPELLSMGSSSGNITPNSGGGGSPVTVNIINNTGADVTQTKTKSAGGETLSITIGKMMAAEAANPSSPFSRTMRSSTGLSPSLATR